jgi:hypothetical protein
MAGELIKFVGPHLVILKTTSMKKYISAIFIFALLLPQLVHAQKESPLKMGIRVAPALDWMNMDTQGYGNDGLRGGFAAGLTADIYFTKNYALSTGLTFNFINGKQVYKGTFTYSDVEYVQANRKYNFNYLEIPVLIKMKTNPFGNFSFFAQAGIGTGFRIRTTVTDKFTKNSGEIVETDPYSYSAYTRLMRWAVIAGIGTEINIDKSSSITVGFNYNNSLNNMFNSVSSINEQEEVGRINFVELNVGFIF